MLSLLSQRLYSVLQFTRMALVFTAISNGWASMLLQARGTGIPIHPAYAIAMTIVSIGLYTFGMALNDLVDRRRDTQIAPGRPIPSGRISVRAGHVIIFALAVLSLAAGGVMQWLRPDQTLSMLLLLWTLLLIVFYDFAGKYLAGLGLLTLGLIRFFHAAVPAPNLAIPWHAITLLVHVTVLSTIGYRLEGKRPTLTKRHIALVTFGLLSVVGTLVWLLIDRRSSGAPLRLSLWIIPELLYPWTAVLLFIILAVILRYRTTDRQQAGRSIMLYGLLWLIVYDAAFVQCYVGWKPALLILALLPISMLTVQTMRWWSKMLELSTKPEYQRAR